MIAPLLDKEPGIIKALNPSQPKIQHLTYLVGQLCLYSFVWGSSISPSDFCLICIFFSLGKQVFWIGDSKDSKWNLMKWFNLAVISGDLGQISFSDCDTEPRNLKGGIRSLLTPVLTLWQGGHIDSHVWRWVIVPSDLAWSFGAICVHYRYCVIHRTITNLRAWFESTRERQLTLNDIIWPA